MKNYLKRVTVVLLALVLGIMSHTAVGLKAEVAPPPDLKWNGEAAAEYAREWADGHNPAYAYYGSDCTNYVSQCIKAGGMIMTFPKSYKDKTNGNIIETNKKWFYHGTARKYACTTSWLRCSGSNNFGEYWKKYVVGTYSSFEKIRKNAEVGDVIQVINAKGEAKHSIIVTKKNIDDLLICAHTNARHSYSFKKFQKDASYTWGETCKYRIFHFK